MLLRSKFGIFGNLCVPEKTPLIDMLRFGIYSKLTDLPIINGSPVMEDSILWLNFNVLGSHRLNNVMYAFRAKMDNHIFIHCTYSKWYLDCLMARLDITIQNETWLQLLDFILGMEDRKRILSVLCFVQIFCYYIWRERNARAHNRGVFGPCKLSRRIIVDVKARIHGYRML